MRTRVLAIGLSVVLVSGCATTVTYTGVGPHPQLERGAPVPPVDFLGNVLSLPAKLLLWSWKFNNHSISPETEEVLVAYPSAQQTLFSRYHVGGCSSCGFQPTDTLEEALRNNGGHDVEGAIAAIKADHEEQARLEVSPLPDRAMTWGLASAARVSG